MAFPHFSVASQDFFYNKWQLQFSYAEITFKISDIYRFSPRLCFISIILCQQLDTFKILHNCQKSFSLNLFRFLAELKFDMKPIAICQARRHLILRWLIKT